MFTQIWFATWVVNTTLALVYPTFTIPFFMCLMAGFFPAVPLEVEEAAWIGGCGMAGALRVDAPTAIVVHLVLDRFVRGLTGA